MMEDTSAPKPQMSMATMPAPHKSPVFPKENETLDPEVAEMVLRTLYLDIDGLRVMPLIELEPSSRCRSMMIPPISSSQ